MTSVKIPLASLSEEDENGQGTPPEEGDAIQFSVSGKVTKIDGDMATVEVTDINGDAIDGEADEKPGDEGSEDVDRDALMKHMQSMDAQGM